MKNGYVSQFEYINHSRRNSVFVIVVYVLLIALIFGVFGFALSYYAYEPGYGTYDDQYGAVDFMEILFPALAAGALGILIALIVCAFTYKRSGKILAKAANAHEVTPVEEPYLFETVDAIAGGVELSTPKIYVIETPELNAFASGASVGDSMIAVTRGMLETMDREELEGVIAHEVAHLKNNDIKFVSLAVALSATLILITETVRHGMFRSGGRSRRSNGNGGNAIAMLVLLVISLVIILLVPLLAKALQGAVSRQREFLADASGASILGYPLGLASALEKIQAHNEKFLQSQKTAFTNSSVHALCISDPIPARVSGLFATHPPISERVRRLRGTI